VILKVPVHLIDGIWPSIESYVIRTCDYHPFMEAPDVLELLKNEMGVLFISVEGNDVVGFGVLEVVKYPRRTVANILGAGGSSGFLAVAIDDLLPVMIEHGKTQGATVVAYSGRPGWLRKLHRYGGESKRYITWWADIDEQGRRKFSAPDNHARAVEASAAIPD
jgi:hypothetical protein